MRIESLTIFRFIAALIVVNFHFGRDLLAWPNIFIAGPEMVAFFFVLSGFVMGYTYLQKQDFSPKKYWLARFKRIAPAYYLALVVAIIVFENIDFFSVVLGALYLQSWVPPYALNLNAPAWSVSVEMFFYLTFPAIVYGIRRFQLSIVQVCIGACAFWVGSEMILFGLLRSSLDFNPPSVYFYLVSFFPLTYWSGFCLGVAGGMWFISHPKRGSWVSTLLAALTVAVICHLINHQADIQSALGLHRLEANILSPLFLLFIVFLAQGNERINHWLSARPLKLLGQASYAMYIFQVPLWFACRRLFATTVENPAVFMLGYLVILIGLSLLFSRYVDTYFSGNKMAVANALQPNNISTRSS